MNIIAFAVVAAVRFCLMARFGHEPSSLIFRFVMGLIKYRRMYYSPPVYSPAWSSTFCSSESSPEASLSEIVFGKEVAVVVETSAPSTKPKSHWLSPFDSTTTDLVVYRRETDLAVYKRETDLIVYQPVTLPICLPRERPDDLLDSEVLAWFYVYVGIGDLESEISTQQAAIVTPGAADILADTGSALAKADDSGPLVALTSVFANLELAGAKSHGVNGTRTVEGICSGFALCADVCTIASNETLTDKWFSEEFPVNDGPAVGEYLSYAISKDVAKVVGNVIAKAVGKDIAKATDGDVPKAAGKADGLTTGGKLTLSPGGEPALAVTGGAALATGDGPATATGEDRLSSAAVEDSSHFSVLWLKLARFFLAVVLVVMAFICAYRFSLPGRLRLVVPVMVPLVLGVAHIWSRTLQFVLLQPLGKVHRSNRASIIPKASPVFSHIVPAVVLDPPTSELPDDGGGGGDAELSYSQANDTAVGSLPDSSFSTAGETTLVSSPVKFSTPYRKAEGSKQGNFVIDTVLAPSQRLAVCEFRIYPGNVSLRAGDDDELSVGSSFLRSASVVSTDSSRGLSSSSTAGAGNIDPALVPLPPPLDDELAVDPADVPLPDGDDADLEADTEDPVEPSSASASASASAPSLASVSASVSVSASAPVSALATPASHGCTQGSGIRPSSSTTEPDVDINASCGSFAQTDSTHLGTCTDRGQDKKLKEREDALPPFHGRVPSEVPTDPSSTAGSSKAVAIVQENVKPSVSTVPKSVQPTDDPLGVFLPPQVDQDDVKRENPWAMIINRPDSTVNKPSEVIEELFHPDSMSLLPAVLASRSSSDEHIGLSSASRHLGPDRSISEQSVVENSPTLKINRDLITRVFGGRARGGVRPRRTSEFNLVYTFAKRKHLPLPPSNMRKDVFCVDSA